MRFPNLTSHGVEAIRLGREHSTLYGWPEASSLGRMVGIASVYEGGVRVPAISGTEGVWRLSFPIREARAHAYQISGLRVYRDHLPSIRDDQFALAFRERSPYVVRVPARESCRSSTARIADLPPVVEAALVIEDRIAQVLDALFRRLCSAACRRAR